MRSAVGAAEFREVMGRFATGVTVVTAAGPSGMTANAICSLSLDPLLALVCFDNGARTLNAVRESGRFGICVLSAGQEELARRFASKLPEAEKFEGVEWAEHDGLPVLGGSLAWIGCEIRELLPGGDHTIGIGSVVAAESGEGEPLVWWRGGYGRFSR